MSEVQTMNKNEVEEISPELTLQNQLEIIKEGIRKNYLSRLTEMEIAPSADMIDLEQDLIDNVRLYHITEMVYKKGDFAADKFTTVFNTLSTYKASVFILLDSNGQKTDIYLGVRNNETDNALKRSTVTLGDTLKTAVIGHFPGVKIDSENRSTIAQLCERIQNQHNISSVSVVGNNKINTNEATNDKFVQGLEKLILAMQGRQYVGLIVAENQSPQEVAILRKNYQEIYTKLTPYQKVQTSTSQSSGKSRSQSFSEMNGKQKAAMLGGAALSAAGIAVGGVAGGLVSMMGSAANKGTGSSKFEFSTKGAFAGGQIGGQLSGFINSLAPIEQLSETTGSSESTTTENKMITDLLQVIDEEIKRTNEFDSYGMWNVAGYFLSDDMAAAEIAASNYRSLMNGENTGREVSAINSWRANNTQTEGNYNDLTAYLSRFIHPKFFYAKNEEASVFIDATIAVSGKELGLHMGLPRETVPGLPVIEHAEFGKEVYKYSLIGTRNESRPEDRMTLGKVFDLGQITDKVVELDNRSLNMHTFITGSTGSGKSNTVYQMLTELYQDKIPFLVVEPAKGEYKNVFGNWPDVNVYSTNPNIAELINLNPFMFPKSIHVLEHVDGLVEIFSVCWPMYDAMPAFFKDAILRSYEAVGWDLGSSTFDGKKPEYPDFEILAEQLNTLIESSDYSNEIKSNYRGALITRVRSLTVGLNKFIFTSEQTPYSKLFDENCILDISRVKSSETKALIMGLMVYILNEYRVDKQTSSNNGLKHVTVLEEAHNLLKNTSGTGESNLIGKSVEMLTQTIAEIRTYGEGFIIVDQSPSSVDIAAIKNTNTKIVLRTPEANDREAVGRSMGLTNDQVNEIAKLPSGVAVVYQNDWVSPVLTMIDKADVEEEPYKPEVSSTIRPLKSSRTVLLKMILNQWINGETIPASILKDSLKVVDLSRESRNAIEKLIEDYTIFNGQLNWSPNDQNRLHNLLQEILQITDKEILVLSSTDELKNLAKTRITKTNETVLDAICYFLTLSEGGE